MTRSTGLLLGVLGALGGLGCSGADPIQPPGNECPAQMLLAGQSLEGSGTEHDGESIQSGEHWAAAQSPHRLTGSLTLTTKLIVDPCAVVEVCDGCDVYIGTQFEAGDLVAVGDATHPIVIRGENGGAWRGLHYATPGAEARLSYVTIEGGEANFGPSPEDSGVIAVDGSAGATEIDSATGEYVNPATLAIDHCTVRGGPQHGIFLTDGSRFSPGSEANIITGNHGAPIRIQAEGLFDTVLDGTYTGNGDDRVQIFSGGISQILHPTTLHALSVPYRFEPSTTLAVQAKLTLEPGVRIEMGEDAGIGLKKDGSLWAVGTAEKRIVIDAEKDATALPTWFGLALDDDTGESHLEYAKLRGAGRQEGLVGTAACTADPEKTYHAAVLLNAPGTLVVKNTEVADIGPDTYAFFRWYLGTGAPEFTGNGNTFTGTFFCSETDQYPVDAPVCGDMSCCDHDYQCPLSGT